MRRRQVLARDRLKIEDIERLLRVVDQLVEIGWSCTAEQRASGKELQ
jgi:hypothetical protein